MAVGSWSSCSSSTSSLGSFDDVVVVKPPDAAESAEEEGGGGGSAAVKFLCSYGGRILPRHTDGALRYVGGDNRVLSVHRRLRFHELLRKLSELCGWEVRQVRCQLPTEDLDALVSVTTDAELASLLEVYDDAASQGQGRLRPLKIRAFLSPARAAAPEPLDASASPPPRAGGSSSPSPSASSGRTTSTSSSSSHGAAAHLLRAQNVSSWAAAAAPSRWWEQQAPARADLMQRPLQQHYYGRHDQARPPHRWLVHNGRHWQ